MAAILLRTWYVKLLFSFRVKMKQYIYTQIQYLFPSDVFFIEEEDPSVCNKFIYSSVS